MSDAAPADDTVNLVNPDGELVGVARRDLGAARDAGYRAPTQEEAGERQQKETYGHGIGNELLAGGLGAARALTFGGSDLLATSAGLMTPSTGESLRKFNPGASMAGEIGGAVLPLLVGDAGGLLGGAADVAGAGVEGVSAIGRATEHVGEHLLEHLGEGSVAKFAQKVVPKIMGGAVEGAAYGAGHEITEASLGDTELTAEKLLAGAGMGAALGGGLQGVIGTTGAGLSAIKRSVEEKIGGTLGESAQKWVNKFAENSRLRTVFGGTKKAFKALDEEGNQPWLREEADKVVKGIFDDPNTPAVMSQAQMADKITDLAGQADKERAEIFGVLDRNTAEHETQRLASHSEAVSAAEGRNAEAMARHEADQAMTHGVELPKPTPEAMPVAGPTRRISTADFLANAEERATSGLEPATAGNAKRAFRGLAEDVRSNYGDTLSFEEASRIRAGIQDKVKNWDATLPNDLRDLWKRTARAMNEHIDEKAATILKEAGLDEAAYQAARRRQAVLIKMEGFARDRANAVLANRGVSLTDSIAGSALAGGAVAAGHALGGPAGFLLGAGLNKLGRVYGPSAIARTADKASRILAIARTASKVSLDMDEALVSFVEQAKRVGGRVAKAGATASERATEKAAHESLGEGGALRKAIVPLTSQVLDSVRFLPDVSPKRLVADQQTESPGKHSSAVDVFKQRAAELTQLASSPERMVDHVSRVTEGISDAAGQTAAHIGTKMMQAAQFLHDKMPKPIDTPNPLLKQAWAPSQSDMDKWARYVRAANDPMTVIEDLKNRRMTAEGVEVLKTLYPKLHEAMVGKIVSQLSEEPAHFSYQDRAQLSLLLGQPLDPTMAPAFVSAMQQHWAVLPKQQGQGGGGTRLSGIDKLRGGEAMQTRSQRLGGM